MLFSLRTLLLCDFSLSETSSASADYSSRVTTFWDYQVLLPALPVTAWPAQGHCND